MRLLFILLLSCSTPWVNPWLGTYKNDTETVIITDNTFIVASGDDFWEVPYTYSKNTFYITETIVPLEVTLSTQADSVVMARCYQYDYSSHCDTRTYKKQ